MADNNCSNSFTVVPPCPPACSEVFQAECIVYTGKDLTCGKDVVIKRYDYLDTIITKIVEYFCANSGTPGPPPPPGPAPMIDIVYADLYQLVVNGELIPGQWYRLLDYKSVNFLNGINQAFGRTIIEPGYNNKDVYVGEEEILILQATSPYEIAEIGYSETFQGDKVQYEPFTNKLGLYAEYCSKCELPDGNVLSFFNISWDSVNNYAYIDMPPGYPVLFGHYFYIDISFGSYYMSGNFEPLTPGIAKCQYDYNESQRKMSNLQVSPDGMKIILLDVTLTDFNNYDIDSLYINTPYAFADAYGWITKREDTYRNIIAPLDFRGRKYRRFEMDLTPVNPSLYTNYWGQGPNYLNQSTTGNYKDFKVFPNNDYDSFNIIWDEMGGPDDAYWYRGYNDNVVFLQNCYKTTIKGAFYDSTLGDSVFNVIEGNFNDNTVGAGFAYNNILTPAFSRNTIGQTFQNNNIQLAGYFYLNTVDSTFNQNLIFCSQVYFCQFPPGVYNNNIYAMLSFIDFRTATHVKAPYHCEIVTGSVSQPFTPYIGYLNGPTKTYVTPINS